jgi:hypothetical protein
MAGGPALARGGGGRGGGGGRSFGGGGGRSFGGGGRSFGGGGRSFGGGGGRSFGGGGGRSFGGGSRGGGGGLGGRDRGGSRDLGGRGNRDLGGGSRDLGGRGNRDLGGGNRDFGGGRNNRGDGLAGMAGNRPSTLPANRIDRANLPNRPVQMPGRGGGLAGVAGSRPRPSRPMERQNLSNQASSIRNSSYRNTRITQINNGNRLNGYHGYHGWNGYGNGAHYPYGWGGGAWGCIGGAALGSLLGVTIGAIGNDDDGSAVSNVVYEGDNVYVNGENAGSSQDYYQEAQQLATQPLPAPDMSTNQEEQWQPLGVFALAPPGAAESTTMLQLEVNSQGAVEGNYLNQLTGESAPVKGSIDKKTQRISWVLGDNTSTVFDTSLPNLLADQTDVLVHFGVDSTQQMVMVRLPEPPMQAEQPT